MKKFKDSSLSNNSIITALKVQIDEKTFRGSLEGSLSVIKNESSRIFEVSIYEVMLDSKANGALENSHTSMFQSVFICSRFFESDRLSIRVFF